MGTSTDAILAYGYDLGGDDAGWKFTFVTPGEAEAWDETGESWHDVMVRRLAKAHGCAPDDPDGYVDEFEVEKRSGVEFVGYVHIEFPSYILAAKEIRVYRGDSKRIESLDVPEGADEKLRAAIEAIGITPNERSGWYLVSYWG